LNIYFVDTSALAKRYVPEVGTQWVLSWILPQTGNVIIVSELASVEMFSLLKRREREGTLLPAQSQILQANFLLHHEQEFLTVPLETAVLTTARDLVTTYRLRTLDAIQLACALQAVSILGVAMTFISADNNLLAAARAENLATDNPNDHS
jgi:uncharacterized protein